MLSTIEMSNRNFDGSTDNSSVAEASNKIVQASVQHYFLK